MRPNVRLLALVVFVTLGAIAVGAPAPVLAQSTDALQTERTRLRTQLDKVNAEIDGLKRAGSGVRDDYRLRARLADAESLARRLIDIEARLASTSKPRRRTTRRRPRRRPTDRRISMPRPTSSPIRSRRVRAQADALGRRAADAKGRQELRRRAADLDRDPFAPMEGSKRRVVSSSGSVAGAPTGSKNQTGAASDVPSSPGQGSTSLTPTAPPTTNTTNSGLPERTSAPLSVQLRDLLDTATLTDVRRVEAAGAAAASPQALERAAAALRARADWLDGQSRAMRARAQAK